MEKELSHLNPEQYAAVTHGDGPLLIVAGAGTGKTTVITERVAYLIRTGRAKPEEILCLTFTDKAAGEMEERIDRLLPFGYLDLWVMTFHAFGERLLRAHGLDLGLPTDFRVVNEFEQWALMRKNLDAFDLDYYRPLGNPAKFIRALLKHFSRAKDEETAPADYLNYVEGLRQDLDNMLNGGKGKKGRKSEIRNLKTSNLPLSSWGTPAGGNPGSNSLLSSWGTPAGGNPGSTSVDSPNFQTDDRVVAEQEVARLNEVANAYYVYQKLLLDNRMLDFGDLIVYTLKLFRERPLILERWRRQFKYILVDEFQDTNWSQYELVKLLAGPRNALTVVGDDDQSIYAFRGASMSNILRFRDDHPDSRAIVLTQNYRSSQNILDLAYAFIQHNNPNRLEAQLTAHVTCNPSATLRAGVERVTDGSHPGLPATPTPNLPAGEETVTSPPAEGVGGGSSDANSDPHPNPPRGGGSTALSKKLISNLPDPGMIEVIAGADLADEVRLVVERIAELKIADREAAWSDFAILVRANDSAREFLAGLQAAALPYAFMAARGLYAKPAVMDLTSYLGLLDDYHESPSLYRILSLPLFAIPPEDLASLNYWAGRKARSLYEVLESARTLGFGAESLARFDHVLALIAKHSVLARDKKTTEVCVAFLEDSGYLEWVLKADEAAGIEAIGHLHQFLERVREFEDRSDDRSVRAFLAELRLEIEAGEEGSLRPDAEAGPDLIRVYTVHGAKGLEFKYVFLVGLVDKRFPTIERKDAIELPLPLVKEILPEGDFHLEEERRLFYVALTRAKSGIFLSWAPDYGGSREKKPSRFLVEAGLVDGSKAREKADQISNSKFLISKTPSGSAVLSSWGPRSHRGSPGSTSVDNPKSQFTKTAGLANNYRIPSYFSFTQLAAYGNCPYQYRFAHILRVPCRGKPALSFGRSLHNTLQKVFLLAGEKRTLGQASLFGPGGELAGPPIAWTEVARLYKESWIDDWFESRRQAEEMKAKGLGIMKAFYDRHAAAWPEAAFLEKDFHLKLALENALYTIRGKIDRIDRTPDGLLIVDYKTGNPKEKLEFADKEQLLIYQLAARGLFNEPVAGLAYYYLEDQSEVRFLGTPAELEKLETKAKDTITAIKSGDFTAKPSRLCAWCDFYGICEYRAKQ